MPRWLTVILGAVAVIGNYSALATSIFPPEHQGQVSAGLTISLAVIAYIAHSYNPDGTPATEAYVVSNLDKPKEPA